MALQDLLLSTRGHLPEPDCPIIRSRRDYLPVRREGYCLNPVLMALQDLKNMSVSNVSMAGGLLLTEE
jgi:hypothetical protein